MAVWCRQTTDDDRPDETYEIKPHYPDQSDAELLGLKEKGAREKGWTVSRTQGVVTATKERWGGVHCVRTFWAD